MPENNDYVVWLENSISEGHIKYYEYKNFENFQPSSFGRSVRVKLKNSNSLFALKSFTNDNQTIVNELKSLQYVGVHENIIRLYGITKTKDILQQEYEYSLVLEYADNGLLRTYLNEHFSELYWSDKYRLAFQLASAVEFLHEKDIIHCDLHPDNVLIHQNNIKLTGFGLSKRITEVSSNTSKISLVIPYVDPKGFGNINYKLNKKSDVYSIGVLFWQISSGYKPFHEVYYGPSLTLSILNGKREEIIDGTPVEYSKLYTECWKSEPYERPNMQQIVSILKSMISEQSSNNSIHKITDDTNYYSFMFRSSTDNFINAEDFNDPDLDINEITSLYPNLSPKIFDSQPLEISDKTQNEENVDTEENMPIFFPNPDQLFEDILKEQNILIIRNDELITKSMNFASGSYGSIDKKYWKTERKDVACKHIFNSNEFNNSYFKHWKLFKHELDLHKRGESCDNIVKIFGVSKEKKNHIYSSYSLIMEFAEGGDLRHYLEKNFHSMKLEQKLKMGYEIANGLKFLHNKQIIHRDLHDKNIVIHNGIAKITDFGNSKSLQTETFMHSNLFGMIPFVAPELLLAADKKNNSPIPYSKSSDIYSLGMLLWEISSGYSPFKDVEPKFLIINIINGTRENRILNMPNDYYNLYESCWNANSEKRPIIEKVFEDLEIIYKNGGIILKDLIDNNLDNKVKTQNSNELYDPDLDHFKI